MPPCPSSRRTTVTAHAGIRSGPSTSYVTWSRRCTGPTLCLRGLDNSTYYMLDSDRSRYANYSGTGNTVNANHPVVRRMILDSLRYWVEEMHVDVDPECLLGATRLR